MLLQITRNSCTWTGQQLPDTLWEPGLCTLRLKGISAVQVQQVFNDMYTAGLQPNIMTYITLMSAYAKLGEWQRAVQLIDHMCQPQVMLAVIITCALSAGLPIVCML